MSLALYRKYRPKTLDEVIGQEHIVSVLRNAAKQNKLAHAYLLYGSRGSGKTTAARLLAKLANCETREKDKKFAATGEPCNECGRCSDIDLGRALDVVEIDAASNTQVDNIRDLQAGIKLSPSSYPYKVFIIDEAHMLSKAAFNALLKTLEEPPAHAIFVLATTDYEKVPATIISRCQRFHFRKLSIEHIISKLKKIVKSEKVKVAEDALELIASVAEGSLRDAESLLDQLTALEKEVTAETVEKTIGQIGFVRTAKLADLILKADLSGALEYISEISNGGYNVVDLNKELIHYLRRVISLKVDPKLESVLKNEFTQKDFDQLKAHTVLMDSKKHIPLLRSLLRAYSEMRYSPFAAAPLEIALIENLQ